jgi:hypothetical protein
MKRLPLALLALALLLVPAATPGNAGATAGAAHTFAVGGGLAPCEAIFCVEGDPGIHFAFSAHQEVGTTSPKGHVVLWFADPSTGQKTGQLSGPVTCLVTAATPEGGSADLTFHVEKSTLPRIPPGTSTLFAFRVIDAGENDAISLGNTRPGELCLFTDPRLLLVTKGNIVVTLQSPAVAAALSGSWYSIGSDGSLSILTETGWEVMQ